MRWSDQKSGVFKVYVHHKTASTDQARLQKLSAILSESVPHHFNFRVAKSCLITDTVMEVENVEGTCLADLLSSRYRTPLIKPTGLIYLVRYDSDNEKQFFLKADNIIVTPDFEFWVIDPY